MPRVRSTTPWTTSSTVAPRLERTLEALNLKYFDRSAFVQLFGNCTEAAPFGDRLWHGMRKCLINHKRLGGKGSPYGFTGFEAGYFRPPASFGEHNSQRPYDEVRDRGQVQYPAVFIMIDDDWSYMRCQHILAMTTRRWTIHRSRILLEPLGEFMNEEEVYEEVTEYFGMPGPSSSSSSSS